MLLFSEDGWKMVVPELTVKTVHQNKRPKADKISIFFILTLTFMPQSETHLRQCFGIQSWASWKCPQPLAGELNVAAKIYKDSIRK